MNEIVFQLEVYLAGFDFLLLSPLQPVVTMQEWRHQTKQGSESCNWSGRKPQCDLIGSHVLKRTNGEVRYYY